MGEPVIRGPVALGDRGFRWFFIARAIAMITSAMSSIALAFAVLQIDNSAGALSLVLATFTVSNVVFLLLGGVVADRLPRAAIIQTCYAVNVLSLATMATLLFTTTATIALLCVLAAVNGASSAFVMPAMQGIVPQLTTPAHLQQANAMLSFVRASVTIGGPVIAGIIVAAAGPAWAMLVEATGLAIAIPVLAMVRLPPPASHDKTGMGSSMLQDLRIGWTELRSRSWLWSIVLAFMGLNALQAGVWGVAGPFIAKNNAVLGIAGWGWVVGAEGVGVLLTAVVLMRVPLTRPLRYGMIGMTAFAIPFALLGVHPAVIPLALTAIVAGIGVEVFNTGWNLAMMENIPIDRLSRVSSYDMLGSFVAIPLGTLAYGWLITHVDVEPLLVTSAIVYAAVALSLLAVPSVWRMGRPSAATEYHR